MEMRGGKSGTKDAWPTLGGTCSGSFFYSWLVRHCKKEIERNL